MDLVPALDHGRGEGETALIKEIMVMACISKRIIHEVIFGTGGPLSK